MKKNVAVSKKNINQLLLVLIDIIIVYVSGILSIALRFDFVNIPQMYWDRVVLYWPMDVAITILFFALAGLYNRVWSYASVPEVVRITWVVILVNVIEFCIKHFLLDPLPRSWYLLNTAIMLLSVIFVRGFVRLRRYFKSQARDVLGKYRIMIVGAGSAGSAVVTELRAANQSIKICCIIDDDIEKKHKWFRGIKIVGGREKIASAAIKYKVDTIIIAISAAKSNDIKDIVNIAYSTGARVRVLPRLIELVENNLVGQLRDIDYEDLLGRDLTDVDHKQIKASIENKTVLITGAGGSIGSELCRQVFSYSPKNLILLDIYENTLYEIERELNSIEDKTVNIISIVQSITNEKRMEKVFSDFRPDIVYHAAAHKHVPLMEFSPCEAVENNCKGTFIMVRLADKYSVKKFVQISTDKAVRPTNIMGASKRVCELIIQNYARNSKTKFSAVRFGNVLGSNGSVIPLFLKQIDNGGPVTITNKEITRFFMSIPEAVSLVLESGEFADGGEIFVLDMGEPVKIYELAKNLIKLRGYKPDIDIKIQEIGLRPGEKLYEEILMKEEGLVKTANEKIYIGKPVEKNWNQFESQLEKLLKSARDEDKNIKIIMSEICETYTPDFS